MRTFGLFCKRPVPGEVKTRLAADIGAESAAILYSAFIDDVTFRCRCEGDRRFIGFWPQESEEVFARYKSFSFELWPQPSGGLGEKISAFFEMALRRPSSGVLNTDGVPAAVTEVRTAETNASHVIATAKKKRGRPSTQNAIAQKSPMKCVFSKVDTPPESNESQSAVLIGTDSPTLPSEYIHQAFEKLNEVDCVLGPATDGGYYLVGLRCPPQTLFGGISWSGPNVLAQTVRNAESLGMTLDLLPPWYDVDDLVDLQLLAGHIHAMTKAGQTHPCPATANVLRRYKLAAGS